MTIYENLEEKKEDIKEELDVNFDKLRRMGSLSGWQKIIYNFIVQTLGPKLLFRAMNFAYDKALKVIPDGTNPEEIKDIIKLAFVDYVDSSM